MSKEKTPLEILNENKQAAQKHAESIATNSPESKSKAILEEELSTALDSGDFSKIISNLSILKDLRSGIKTHISDDLGNKTRSLVRDAREAIDPPIIAPESYAMMFANHARAAISVAQDSAERGEITQAECDKITKEIQLNVKYQIKKIITDFASIPPEQLSVELQNNKKDKTSLISKLEADLKSFNGDLAKNLKRIGVADSKKKLKVAKEFTNFDDEHYHVSTISKIGEATIIENEVMNLGLTAAQNIMFRAIRDYKTASKSTKMKIEDPNLEWFNILPRWKQDLIKKHASDILSGKKVIPTQLRKELPLLRNAYTKTASVQKTKGNPFVIVEDVMHSGTLTTGIASKSIIPGAMRRLSQWIGLTKDRLTAKLTEITTEQLKLFSPSGKVFLNVLTSPANPFQGVDVSDSVYLRHNTEKGIYKSTLPFNAFRKLIGGGGRDLSGHRAIVKELNNSENQTQAAALQSNIDAIGKLSPDNKQNKHSQLVERGAIICSFFPKLPKINISCASGKDRTQMVLIGATSRAIASELGLLPEQVAKILALSGNSQYLSGGNGGGTLGCYGQKPETTQEGTRSLFFKLTNYFGQRTADLNKFPTSKQNKTKEKTIILEEQITEKSKEDTLQAEKAGQKKAKKIAYKLKDVTGFSSSKRVKKPLIPYRWNNSNRDQGITKS